MKSSQTTQQLRLTLPSFNKNKRCVSMTTIVEIKLKGVRHHNRTLPQMLCVCPRSVVRQEFQICYRSFIVFLPLSLYLISAKRKIARVVDILVDRKNSTKIIWPNNQSWYSIKNQSCADNIFQYSSMTLWFYNGCSSLFSFVFDVVITNNSSVPSLSIRLSPSHSFRLLLFSQQWNRWNSLLFSCAFYSLPWIHDLAISDEGRARVLNKTIMNWLMRF